MKRLSFFIITTLYCLSSISQSLKTFSGEIVDGHFLQHGNVTYTYYEDPKTQEVVKQGFFKYVFIGEGDSYKGFNEIITGSFNKGLKTGIWKYDITFSDWNSNERYWTGSTVLIANYMNGYAEGNWKETTNSKNRKLYMSYGKYVWGQFENLNTDTIIMNFKRNYLVGKFHVNDKFNNNYIDGNFDKNSLFIGNWTINNFDWGNRLSLTFKEGFNYYYIKRGNDMHTSYGPETYDVKYSKLSNALKMTTTEREDAGYTIDTIGWVGCQSCYTGNFKQYIDKLLNNDNFIYQAIGGDLTYKNGIRGGYEIDLKESKSKKELRLEDSINANKQRILDSINLEKRVQDSINTINKRIHDSTTREVQRIQDSTTRVKQRIQDSTALEKQRIQDSIIKHENDSAMAQNFKDSDTLDNFNRLHNLNYQTISNKFNINETTSSNSNNSNDLLKLGSSLSVFSSSGLNERKILIYQKYIRLSEYYSYLNKRLKSAHQKIPIAKKQSLIDDQLISISSNRDIKDLAKKLDSAQSDEAIETILLTPTAKKD